MADGTGPERKSPPLLLGYLPLILAAAAIVVMVLVVPSRTPDNAAVGSNGGDIASTSGTELASPLQAQLAGGDDVAAAAPPPATDAGADTTEGVTTIAETSPAAPVMSVWSPTTVGGASAPGPTATTPVTTAAPATTESAPASTGEPGDVAGSITGWGTTVAGCGDRDRQTDDDYSPPCFELTGDNGGETSRGVTADSITVTYRFVPDAHLIATLSALAGGPIDEDAEDLWRTTEGLIDYFNQNYQFYGRQIVLERFDGTGNQTAELTGAGQEAAAHDGLVAIDHGAFADVGSGFQSTQPYAEVLAAGGVVTIGAPYMSRDWFASHAPYAWSAFPDCTLVAETAALVSTEILLPEPVVLGGEEFRGQQRRLGVVHPNTDQYTECVDHYVDLIGEAGFQPAQRQNYTLDLGATNSNATSILARLKDAGITSVGCSCDPLMMQALAALAEQQDYHPEWFIAGVGFIDLDVVGQMIASSSGEQWTNAIGGSPTPAPLPFGESEAYRAYRSVRDDEPSLAIDIIYAQLLRLAIGIQMAGPELNPDTFAQGLYHYPAAGGELGGLDFAPNNHAGQIDVRLVYWSNDAISPFNGLPGTYIDDGNRYSDISQAPRQEELIALAEDLGLLPPSSAPPGTETDTDAVTTPAATAAGDAG